ncbi:MAG TPA: DUF481 domain-containing protein [Verrucomicrobiae bacterium]|nr:DUF481 domain-containing protein [Verrucomicrobiae bacterium]
MKRHILFLSVLVVLAVRGHASEPASAVATPTNKTAVDSNAALTFLAAETSTSRVSLDAAATNHVSTNKPAWDGTVAFGLTAATGNSDSALATGNFRAHRKTPRDEWTLGADGAYGQVNSIKNNETLHGYIQYNHLFSERWYGYARADALHDGIADVTYRFTFSPGVGYYFIKTNQTSLAGEFGPAVLYEKLDDEYHTYPVLRLAEHFEHKFDSHARVWEDVEFLPPANSPKDFLVNAEIGLETPLTRHLSLQTYVQDNYANRPAAGHKDNDAKLVSALAYKF